MKVTPKQLVGAGQVLGAGACGFDLHREAMVRVRWLCVHHYEFRHGREIQRRADGFVVQIASQTAVA